MGARWQAFSFFFFFFLFSFFLFSSCCFGEVFVKQFGRSSLYRDSEYGVPVVLGGNASDVFRAVGYAQAQDRLFQIFLRLAAANGRLSEFLGPGRDRINVATDTQEIMMRYTPQELQQQFAQLNDDTQEHYRSFVEGMQEHLVEVNGDPALLPFEFYFHSISVIPEDLFNLTSVLSYALSTLRRLTDGFDPTYQLDNMKLLDALSNNIVGSSQENVSAAFNDLATVLGAFPLYNVVTVGNKTLEGESRAYLGLKERVLPNINFPRGIMKLVESRSKTTNQVNQHLKSLGAITADGSWAIVDGATEEKAFAQYGPQDPNTFPTTFYEVFIDAENIAANYFSEPGMPVNQLYGVFGNITLGRNRGYVRCNDYLFEPMSNTAQVESVTLKVKGEPDVHVPVTRSNSGGFVVSADNTTGIALTLRTPFISKELVGLNMLAGVFAGLSFDQLYNSLFEVEMQSNLIHSHLEIADINNVAAVLNGLTTTLPSGVDRRFPTNYTGDMDQLPHYNIHLPYKQKNKASRYFSWNSPYNREIDWGGYTYGGEWRSIWINNFFEENPKPSYKDMEKLPAYMAQCNSLQLGGSGEHDLFPKFLYSPWIALLPKGEKYDQVCRLLKFYRGFAFPEAGSGDLSDSFVLANAWVFRVMQKLFGTVLPQDTPRFSLPLVDFSSTIPLPRHAPNSRLASVVALLFGPDASLVNFDWLEHINMTKKELVVSALDEILQMLPFSLRPWGTGARPFEEMKAVGSVLEQPLARLPDGQLPSLNVLVEMGKCGAESVSSSLPFGASGFVKKTENNALHFSHHTRDQLPLYRSFQMKKAPRRFNATQECLDRQKEPSDDESHHDQIDSLVLGVVAATAVVLILMVLAATLAISYVAYRRFKNPSYEEFGSFSPEASMETHDEVTQRTG